MTARGCGSMQLRLTPVPPPHGRVQANNPASVVWDMDTFMHEIGCAWQVGALAALVHFRSCGPAHRAAPASPLGLTPPGVLWHTIFFSPATTSIAVGHDVLNAPGPA